MMPTDRDERMKRPTPERTRPIRSWGELFGLPKTPGGAPHERGADSLDDAVTRSVDLGYRVVEDYVRRGQDAARRMRGGESGTQALAADARDLATRVVKYASDLAVTWAEFLELAMQGSTSSGEATDGAYASAERPASQPGAGDDIAPAATSAGPILPLRINVRIDAAREVDVALDLTTIPASFPITVYALRAPSGDRPRLEGASLATREDGVATLELNVSADQPPGTYDGLLIDDRTNRPLGRLTVSIRDRR